MNGELTSVLILCVYFAAFIQTDSELRYLADGVAVPVSEVRPKCSSLFSCQFYSFAISVIHVMMS